MAFFSFALLKDSFTYLSEQIEPNQKYYSKDIALWKELNNRNKKKQFCTLGRETRLKTNILGKKLLICLPPKFGLGDAVEYSIALKSLTKSKKFNKIGLAFCSNHSYIFKEFFSFNNIYPILISDEQIKKYDTIFHVTLEVKALKFQKYFRSNIAKEVCKHFNVPITDLKIKKNINTKNYLKTISIFPVSTSVIRSLPYNVIEELIQNFKHEYQFRIFIDESPFSKYLEEKNLQNNFEFVRPKNIESLIKEIAKINFGIFVDSGPLHIAKILDKEGILIETSVSEEILLSNSKKIHIVKNIYSSNYCYGPCGLVDIFAYDNNIGCYETNKLTFEKIKSLKNFKNLQRFNKIDNNAHFIFNPVGCIKNIDVKNIIELVKTKIKEN